MNIKPGSRSVIIAAAAGAAFLGLGNYVWRQEHRPQTLDVYVLNPSVGRSLFIRTPDDYRVLVDGGSGLDAIKEITDILPFYSRRIDAILVSSEDGKNIAGLLDVLSRYDVGRVYLPDVSFQSLALPNAGDQIYGFFIKKLEILKKETHRIGAGDTVMLGGMVKLRVLFPASSAHFAYSRSSAPEILFSLAYADTALAFLGNASHKVQEFVAVDSDSLKKTDALIISQSALPKNISIRLMNKLQPRYLIYSRQISSKNTKENVPAIDPLASVADDRRLNIRERGTVHLISDGRNLLID